MAFNVLIIIALAILPALFILFRLYYKDAVNKEPISLLIKLFFFGVLIAIPVYLIEVFVEVYVLSLIPVRSLIYSFLEAFICVALTEEGFKYLAVKCTTWDLPEFDSTFDGIIYCAFVSLGFASIENIAYAYNMGVNVLPYRALLSIPGHLAFSLTMGVFYSKAKQIDKFNKEFTASYDYKYYLKHALLFAVLFHGFYDFCLMVDNDIFLVIYFIFVVFMYVYIFKTIRYNSKNDRLFL